MRAGYAAIDVTPGRDLGLVGYEYRHEVFGDRNDGVNDPLFLRAVTLADDAGEEVIVLAIDQCLLSVAWARELRAAVAAAAELPRERVHVACTHTHSGPWTREPGLTGSLGRLMPASLTPEDAAAAAYRERLAAACGEAARAARSDVFACVHRWFEAPLGLAYRRRVLTADGVEHCWNPAEQVHLRPDPQPDPTLTGLQLRAVDGDRQILFWSHAAHPVVLGKESNVVSADWPGGAARCVEGALPGARSVFVPGACGDTHPWLATQTDPAAVDTVGRAAGSLLVLLASAGGGWAEEARLVCRDRTWSHGAAELDLGCVRLGGGTILTAPVEAFSALSLRLRAHLDGPVLFATVTDGWTGYWPDRTAFAEGGYELKGAERWERTAGSGEELADRLAELARDAVGLRP